MPDVTLTRLLKTPFLSIDEIEIEKRTDMTYRKKILKWSNYQCEDWWKLYDSSLDETYIHLSIIF